MHRHKIAAALAVAALPTLAALSGPAAAETVYHGPKCADVVDGSAAYDGTSVIGRMLLGATACKNVTYTLYVTDGTTTTTLLATTLGTPATTVDGAPAVTFSTAVTDPTPTDGVCVYVTTTRGGKVYDRAPDTGCVSYTVDGGAGGLSYK
ncbi:MAG: hypothetical protein QOK15_121 [Nocardioidaceae bacterium]|jgi:hypothetical protein|nr:hypothetical protein [Nocardioidaceae bacterium]